MSWPYATPGIPDEEFIRAEGVPMTKAEIRALALSKLRLIKGGTLVDVGCGTGTISVEAALIMGEGSKVYAIDKDPLAVEITKKNAAKFGVGDRLIVAEGDALELLPKLPRSNRYFLGGGGRELPMLFQTALELAGTGGVIVADVITLESLRLALDFLENAGVKYELAQVYIARGRRLGGYTILSPLNPVYIITAYA
ncbi:precorrin-6Y C5,15-methyltransferase (decarboxylating) subunit CbiT [Pyrobaculum aerophilum]|uniref:precorrin-6Y C5,15-methyltransferase (decarboxylating) subunit CbiT n=1 Tax=Pyrobaculum aerophilum TaxID=13773 RepID=UPI002FD9DDAB